MIKRLAPVAATLVAVAATASVLGGCALLQSEVEPVPVRVDTMARNQYCASQDSRTRVNFFVDAAAVEQWSAQRNVELLPEHAPRNAAYAVVELGERRTGGYGLAVSQAAEQRGRVLVLTASFFEPPPGMLTQAITSPCVLVRLPGAGIREVEVHGPGGQVQARSRDN